MRAMVKILVLHAMAIQRARYFEVQGASSHVGG